MGKIERIYDKEKILPEDRNITQFLNDLGQQVTGELRTDTYNRMLYSTDASIYQVMPHGVLIPKTVEDIHAAVELANKYKVPILPRTGGSSLAGQAVNEALIIDVTRHLNNVLEVNPEEQWVRVQPGLVLDELNLHLKSTGLQFGPDPASANRAGMGGIVANNSTGTHSVIYGMAADHVLETGVILSDGTQTHFKALSADELRQHQQKPGLEGTLYRQIAEMAKNDADIIRAGTPRHWRRCGGYGLDRFVDEGIAYQWPKDPRFNLAKIISGSEGTLAVMTEIKLNLVPTPTKTAWAIIHFDDLYPALDATQIILHKEPAAIELLDKLSMSLCRTQPTYARMLSTFTEGEPEAVLLTEFYGESEAELTAKLDDLERYLKQENVGYSTIIRLFDPALMSNVKEVRKAGLGFLMSKRGDHKPIPFIEDSAVPIEHLADYVTQIQQFCADLDTDVAYYAHASGGCLHIRPFINSKATSGVQKLSQISSFAAELLGDYDGVLSSEHGDGRVRSGLNERF
ncbi:MAG: FAD-binding oxidoreductase, partial [Chloroflexota bacterium]